MVTQITLLIPDPQETLGRWCPSVLKHSWDQLILVSLEKKTDLTLASKANSGQYSMARILMYALRTGPCRPPGTWSMWWNIRSSCQSYRSVVLLQEVSKRVRELLCSLRPPKASVVQGPSTHVLQG